MTLTTFQKLLSELLTQYNEEAENHRITQINVNNKTVIDGTTFMPELITEIEIKTTGK